MWEQTQEQTNCIIENFPLFPTRALEWLVGGCVFDVWMIVLFAKKKNK